jgi:hypothetical protein
MDVRYTGKKFFVSCGIPLAKGLYFQLKFIFLTKGRQIFFVTVSWPVQRIQYSDSLMGWKVQGQIRGKVKIYPFSEASRSVLEPTNPLMERVPGAFCPGISRQGREGDLNSIQY